MFISHCNGHGIKLVRPMSTVDNTRDYARVSRSRQWSNYNIIQKHCSGIPFNRWRCPSARNTTTTTWAFVGRQPIASCRGWSATRHTPAYTVVEQLILRWSSALFNPSCPLAIILFVDIADAAATAAPAAAETFAAPLGIRCHDLSPTFSAQSLLSSCSKV